MKISHKELETCRHSPKRWVAIKQEQASGSGGPRFGFNQALNYAICELHKANSLKNATKKLEGYLEKFKNEKKMDVIRERLLQYSTWLEKSGIVPVDSNVTINYPFQGVWHLGGTVSRVDLTPTGYRAVLFEAIAPEWKAQLRMPLIQLAIADRYGRPEAEVKVGFHDLDGNVTTEFRFPKSKMSDARLEFTGMGIKVLKLWGPAS